MLSNLKSLKMAVILDEFSLQCLSSECEIITFSPNNWEEILTRNEPDILFVESAWQGNGGTWQYMIGKYCNQDNEELRRLIHWCKARKIPTVFWNKEDPFYYYKFINSAKLFDYIFTTDENMIDKYKREVEHTNVFTLQFAAQPRIHNPINCTLDTKLKLCFAGSYYSNRHIDRKKDLEELLDASIKYGLDIYDRNYEKNMHGGSEFIFPERFTPYIKEGSLGYKDIYKAYKQYACLINVNTIKNSPTMFSRRVFEAIACGTPIVSNYSVGIENTFGKNIVMMGDSKDEYDYIIEEIMTDRNLCHKRTIKGIREILNKHTYKKRIETILEKIEMDFIHEVTPKVTVVSVLNSVDDVKNIFNNYVRQSYTHKQLLILVEHRKLRKFLSEYLKRQVDIKKEEISIINNLIIKDNIEQIFSTEYLTYFNSENYYGTNFILDLVNSIQYCEANVIGKRCYYKYKNVNNSLQIVDSEYEFKYVNSVCSDACIIRVAGNVEDSKSMFSCDRYNYIKGYREQSDDDIIQQVEV